MRSLPQVRELNSLMKVTLATSLTILIIAGSVPLLIQSSEGEAGNTAYSGRLTIEFTEVSHRSNGVFLRDIHAESEIKGSLRSRWAIRSQPDFWNWIV